ncbi:DeoR/GlpR transcriptional regulator [Archangium violaceum]|uniref:DeoR/GlpR family DNA-binding transcription regulator n=1 Tax=Archangium violaceum TaxID=83451 RepID=UPI00195180C4|nr:DeoR/GlpR family DNA-binding transcription regulator [Archangium violaceum]QRN94440.1 DeoR/GlpR transcriptional regulator [Archangium violaceum]
MLKEERHQRILEILGTEGRLVAGELSELLGVSGYTIRRDLDELAEAQLLRRVHGGAVARSPVASTYEERQQQGVPGKIATARAAATLLQPGQVVILDGGTTALHLVDAIPPDHTGTFITHCPAVASALARHPGIEVVLVGGTLDRRAMVAVGANVIDTYRRITADVCFLGIWSLNATSGISGPYYEEVEVRRVLLDCADRIVGLASREKLGTVAPFSVGPATGLTHLATEPGVPEELLRPFVELGIHIVQSGRRPLKPSPSR